MANARGGFPHFSASIASSFLFGPFSTYFGIEVEHLKPPELSKRVTRRFQSGTHHANLIHEEDINMSISTTSRLLKVAAFLWVA